MLVDARVPQPVPVAASAAHLLDRPAAAPAPLRSRARTMLVPVLAAFAVFMLLGNGLIYVSSWWLQSTSGELRPRVPGVKNVRVVDDRVLRGNAPTAEGLRALAGLGVTTVVDLRAERELHVDEELLDELGLHRVAMPVRDGQRPTEAQVQRFLDIVDREKGRVFVHCGAGVGRTGAMVAAYRVLTGQATGPEAVRANLAVGPPSLEQLSYAYNIRQGEITQPHAGLVAASRILDAPRRLLSYLD